jgi:hypothetical protein
MPGADRVGMSLLKDVHHHDDHGSGYGKDAHGGKH